jgi:AcrR family transcriptional regulator
MRHNTQRKNRAVTTPRERILAVADDLFYRYGIRSVGVDRIIAESNVAKMTFYKYFPSKRNLIVAYLDQRKEFWGQALEKALSSDRSTTGCILAVFDVLDEMLRMPSFQGCPFIKALAEFGSDYDEAEIQARISSHFDELNSTICGLIRKLNLPEPMSSVIVSLILGAIIVAHTKGCREIAQVNREAARLLLTGAAHSHYGPTGGRAN